MTTLSELWDQNAPPPRWRRALAAVPREPIERVAAWIAGLYVVAVVVELAVVLRP